MSRLPRTGSDKAVTGMKVSSRGTPTKPLWRRRDSDRVHAEGRPTYRPLSRLLRRRPIPAGGTPRREALGRGVADHTGGRECREGARPRASGGGRQGVPLDALAERRPSTRPRRLLQDVDRAEGREAHQGVPLTRARSNHRWSCGVRTSSTRRLPVDTKSTEWITAPISRKVSSTLG